MAMIPIALQLLPLIPSLIDNALKVVDAVRQDPATPEEAKADLAAVSDRLNAIVERVKLVRLPA